MWVSMTSVEVCISPFRFPWGVPYYFCVRRQRLDRDRFEVFNGEENINKLIKKVFLGGFRMSAYAISSPPPSLWLQLFAPKREESMPKSKRQVCVTFGLLSPCCLTAPLWFEFHGRGPGDHEYLSGSFAGFYVCNVDVLLRRRGWGSPGICARR